MTAADVLEVLVKTNLAAGAAILAVFAVRKLVRARFGARLAYGLWLLPLLASAAVLAPARQVVVVRNAVPVLVSAARESATLAAPPSAGPAARLDTAPLLVGLWLAGVVGAALVMAVLQHRFVTRARRGGVGPAVVGLIAPRILIPRDFAELYSPPEQALVLAHEQAHLARQDSRLNGLAAALQCLCWFNPLVHLAARLMRVDQELACDETVASRFPDARRAYAEVLMKAQLAVLPLPLGCYWPSKSQHPLVERVAMLKRPRIGRTRWRAGAVVLGGLWAGVGLAAWASQPAEMRTVFKAASVAPQPAESLPSDAQATDGTPRPVAARDHSDEVALAAANARPRAILLPNRTMQVDHVLIVGAQRIDQDKILSLLGIRPGDSVAVEKLDAADKALFDSGLFADWRIQAPPLGGSGDLRVWVKEKTPPQPVSIRPPSPAETQQMASGDLVVRVAENPLINNLRLEGNAHLKDDELRGVIKERSKGVFSGFSLRRDIDGIVELYREAGWPDAQVTSNVVNLPQQRVDVTLVVHEGARRRTADRWMGPISVTADHAERDGGGRGVVYIGNVETVQRGRRVLSDLLALSSRAPGDPGGPGLREARWEGDVRLDMGDQTATANRAVYDGAAKTITLSGNVFVQKGRWVVEDDRLVIEVKDQ